jgi:hypothetical protein
MAHERAAARARTLVAVIRPVLAGRHRATPAATGVAEDITKALGGSQPPAADRATLLGLLAAHRRTAS